MSLPTLYRTGYQWYRNSTDTVNDVDIYPGNCRSDDDLDDITSGANFTPIVKRLDANWVVGTNQGGLDTGSRAANTWYFVWAIKRTDTGVVDILLSTSPSSPTMPTNYNRKRLIGAIRTNGTNLQAIDTRFVSGSIYVRHTDPVENGLDVNVTNLSTTKTDYTLTAVPPFGDSIYASVVLSANVVISTSAGGGVYISNPGIVDAAPTATASPLATMWQNAGGAFGVCTQLYADRNAKVSGRSNVASTTLRIQVLGYYWPDGANQ
jgi:hypothetical protein